MISFHWLNFIWIFGLFSIPACISILGGKDDRYGIGGLFGAFIGGCIFFFSLSLFFAIKYFLK